MRTVHWVGVLLAGATLLCACGGSSPDQSNDGGSITETDDGGSTDAGIPPEITTTGLPNVGLGQQYAAQLTATGGSGALIWNLSGTPPIWIGLDPSTGVLSGNTSSATPGAVSLTVMVRDQAQRTDSRSFSFTVTDCQQDGGCLVSSQSACVEGNIQCDSQGKLLGCIAPSGNPVYSTDPAGCGTGTDGGTECGRCDPAVADSCANGKTCVCGASGSACTGGQSCCGDGCVDLLSNVADCLQCGHDCRVGQPDAGTNTASCTASGCVYTCNSGLQNCDGVANGTTTDPRYTTVNDPDGCEIDTTKDASNCGACGVTCPPPKSSGGATGTGTCSSSTCGYTCSSSHLCGDTCYPYSDANHCGPSCIVCPTSGNHFSGLKSPGCNSRGCQLNCDPGYADCNGNPSDGCEIDLNDNRRDCGFCGFSCGISASEVCCSGMCTSGIQTNCPNGVVCYACPSGPSCCP